MLFSHFGLESEEQLREEYNKIIDMGKDVIRILEDLHSHGYIHCDIKPFNILLDERATKEPNAYLIDFGIARRYLDSKGRHI